MDYIIGKNAADNFKIIQQADPHDLWFHLADQSSAHLVAKNIWKKDIKELRKSGEIYRLACKLKKHSKLKDMTTINYTYIENITMTQDIGKVKLSKDKYYRVDV